MSSAHRKSAPHLRLVTPPELRPQTLDPARLAELEAELMADLCSPTPRRANELYRYLAPVVHAALFKVLGRADEDHEDLMQSAFEQIAVSIIEHKFARNCRLTTWASVIAARTGLMAIRARKRARRHLGPQLDQVSPEPELPAEGERITSARESLLEVREVLASMSEERAVVLVLHDALGHDLQEIGALLSISVAAAQSRLVRGRSEFLTKYRQREADR